MGGCGEQGYFYSIQPFWEEVLRERGRLWERAGISVCRVAWDCGEWLCVPGNGQIGITVSGEEELKGICYGVLDRRKEISLYDIGEGFFIRFSPGRFSEVFAMPASEICPEGMELSDLLSAARLGAFRDALRSREPESALLALFQAWERETGRKGGGSREALACQLLSAIWKSKGNVKVRELEQETAYSARRIQEVLLHQAGIGPKQLCRQTRFQNALRILHQSADRKGLNMAQEALSLGYCDQAHYSREFKEFCGVSPGQYRGKGENCLRTACAPHHA